MAKKMPGTSKQRSVSRPAQGLGKRTVIAGKPRGLRPAAATPSRNAPRSRSGSLDAS
jgi:hypothetical protein